MRRSGTLSYTGALGANESAAMDISFKTTAAPVAGDYYAPVGSGVPNTSVANVNPGVIMGRNYTITALYAASHANSDDVNETWHLYINGSSASASVNITNGGKIGSTTGLSIPVSAGDQILMLFDALSDAASGSNTVTIHLEPR